MKAILSAAALGFTSLILLSFNENSSISFETALKENKISMRILPTGTYCGNSINLEVKNLTSGPLKLQLPAGTTFEPGNTSEQTLVTSENEMLALGARGQAKLAVNAFCTELHDHCPGMSSTFTMSKTKNASLLRLVALMDSLKIKDTYAIQNSIWSITDGASVSEVYSDENPNAAKALRTYICSVTHQPDTWYDTKSEIRVNEQQQIVRVPKDVKGNIEYSSDVEVELQGVIKDGDGKIIFTNPRKLKAGPGNISFEFSMHIEGWKPGNYSVVYTSNGKELINQPFTIE